MAKKRNKKKGSTLVIVLSVAIVMMLLSGVIANSIMGTMKANVNQKEREDLKYAAESGLEIARSHLGDKTTITQADINAINIKANDVLVDKDKNGSPDGEIGSVEIISPRFDGNGTMIEGQIASGNINGFKVKIKATRRGAPNESEETSIDYNQKLSNSGDDYESIFEHSIVAGQGGIEMWNCRKTLECGNNCSNQYTHCTWHCYGHLEPHYASGSLSSSTGVDINGKHKEPNANTIKEGTYQEINFAPNTTKENLIYMTANDTFDTLKKNFLEKVKFTNGSGNEVDVMKVKIDKTNMDSILVEIGGRYESKTKAQFTAMQKSAVMLVEIEGVIKQNNNTMVALMINADNVEMKLNGGANTLKQEIMIVKGSLKVSGKGSLHLAYATLIAARLEYNTEMAMDISYPAGIPGEQGIITDLTSLNDAISILIPNWKQDDDGLGNGSGESNQDIEEIQGSFGA